MTNKSLVSPLVSDIGYALVRVITGWFIYRYARELFHIGDLLNFLADEKIPFPVFTGYAAKIIELTGAISLILGLGVRWVMPFLIIVMYGVIYTTAHGNFYEGEVATLYLLLFAVFFFKGAGKWSVDEWLTGKATLPTQASSTGNA